MPYRYCPGSKSGRTQTTPPEDEPYNIIPVHNLRTDHPSLRFSEVRAVASALRAFGDLRLPPHGQWHPAMDLLDWLALFFCFQHDNFKNQREHLVLQLANSQMRLSLLPENIDTLDAGVLRTFRRKLLKNYTNWCSYLGKKSNVWISKSGHSNSDHRRELLYILEDYIDENTGQPVMPLLSGENAFLYCVVKLIYETVKAEVENSKNRTAPHTAWRNYDDLNDYFWIFVSSDCHYCSMGREGAILDVGMQYSRVSRDTCGLGFRMVLKAVVAAGWIVTFPACYVRIWSQRSQYRRWSAEAATKFAFSYFLQIKPMIKPTKQLLGLNNVDYEWPGGSIKLAVGLLWLPVVFIYLMDIQIWYSIYSSFVGAGVGLLQHLEEQLLDARPTFKNKFNDAISMLKLRYGLGQPYRKLESNQVEAQKFALLVDAPDKWLWHKISKNEYRRCAVIESYDSIKHMMLEILNARSEEYSVFAVLFHEIDHSIEIEKFTKTFKMTSLPQIHLKLIQLVEILTKPKKDASQVVYILQALYEIAVRDFFKDQRTIEQLREDGLAPRDPAAMAGLLFEKVVKLPDPNDEKFYRQVRRLHTILTSKDSMQNIPVNLEARRGQTLFRTIRGVMYYYRALKMLAFLDSASEMDIREGIQELGSVGEDVSLDGFNSKVSPSSRSLGGASSSLNLLFKGHEKGASLMKFTYVVACQIYGAQKDKKDPHAKEILYLMKHNEALRVAYVDDVSVGRDEKEYYSVLVKYDQQLQKEVEIYHVQLPSPLKLGEGKPENQNHAIIFTRGDAVQTIDMNQENYFEETLKMRNLLEEYKSYYGIRKPTILGVREHIFTGSVSSLTWFMSAQETSFVTLGQCVLANPLKIRMHYGHPDIFNRFWVLTQGGISKVSRMVNISEDIFTGFNCTLRGGNVSHHEYIQVGKGRDVGLNQISMFETKVASENGEEVLSRDVYRLGHRLDFFWILYLALSGIEIAALASNNNNNKALSAILNQQFIIQLGIFTALPMIVENSLEHGFLQAIWDFLTMQLQLSSVFYTFTMGTRTHFFGWTVLHGRPKYRGTGRGFVVQHKSFAENYRLYVRSHFIKAIEFGLILTIYASHNPDAKDTFVYIAMTISSWFLVLSWIMAPFVFNPSGFDWLKTVDDFDEFMNWIWYCGGVFAKAERSWERWWYEEQDHLRTTSLWGKILEIVLDLWFFFFQYGMVYQLGIAANSTPKEHIYFQLVQFLVIVFGILVVIARLEFTSFKFIDILTSLLAFIPTGWGLISIAQGLRPFLQSTRHWESVVYVARLLIYCLG
ncbi:hypothetical protein GOBAR_DD15721 [Gossypium barbadense]|nr:hypothetical protein GOBAR_DD15721 [Gossypium barbadense]